jgi:hypothetical protein
MGRVYPVHVILLAIVAVAVIMIPLARTGSVSTSQL